MPEISILMSIFNETKEEIFSSINSLIAQSYKDFEIILVNNNPLNDDYSSLMEDLAKKDYRIKTIVNEQNIGLAMSMNKAANLASGKYLFRMDSDDVCGPDRLNTELDILNKNDADLVFTNYSKIDSNGIDIEFGKPALPPDIKDNNLLESIIFKSIIHHPTVAMKRTSFFEVGGYRDFPCAQDLDLWLRMLEAGQTFLYFNEATIKYRVRDAGVSKMNSAKQYLTIMYIKEMQLERIKRSGIDSFSKDNYSKYIASHTNGSKVKHFKKAYSLLVQNNKKPFCKYVSRLTAFIISSICRRNYLFNKNKKRCFLRYFKSKKCKTYCIEY